jgi:hypothetical protein
MKNIFFLLLAVVILVSCKKDKPDPPISTPPPVNEEEVITSAVLTFTNQVTQEVVVWSVSDPDGDGGNAPIFSVSPLAANSVYNLEIEFFNETENPIENLTDEILEEGVEHQIFYQVEQSFNVTFFYDDVDNNGQPIGLKCIVTTGDAGVGALTVTLIHEPEKDADGVSGGYITNAGGETDFEVTFSGIIQ